MNGSNRPLNVKRNLQWMRWNSFLRGFEIDYLLTLELNTL